jgi:hypothetical protein
MQCVQPLIKLTLKNMKKAQSLKELIERILKTVAGKPIEVEK